VGLAVLGENVDVQLGIYDGSNDGQIDGSIDGDIVGILVVLLDGFLMLGGKVGFIVGHDDADDTLRLLVGSMVYDRDGAAVDMDGISVGLIDGTLLETANKYILLSDNVSFL